MSSGWPVGRVRSCRTSRRNRLDGSHRSWQDHADARTDIPAGWDERTVLTTFLDYVRATVHAKCEHLAEADARRAPLPGSPLMTLAGLVNHLRWVEYFWFQVMLLGEDDHGPWTEEDPDREMRIAVEVPIAQLLDEYEAQCARYRDLVASLELDTGSDSLSWPHLGRFRP
jgi:hypothetical protein